MKFEGVTRRGVFGAATLAAAALPGAAAIAGQGGPAPTSAVLPIDASAPLSAEAAQEIAVEAYIYAYPLVLSELTRRVTGKHTSTNQFRRLRAFPDPSFTAVVRPNADTLYSILWFDLTAEPLAIRVPASQGRYYLLPMMDMWTDVFASPGSRTTGDGAQLIVLAGPGWNGRVPPGATLIRSPTTVGWILGRPQTNGVADYENVHRFQDGLTATPLSRLGSAYTPPPPAPNPAWDVTTPPVEQIETMSAEAYFGLFAELMKLNPPHPNDYSVLFRMARLGLTPGASFAVAAQPEVVRQALAAAPSAGLRELKSRLRRERGQNGWRTVLSGIGTYGTNYLSRAAIAYSGMGANTIEDAIYPFAFADADGQPFSSDRRYVMHFAPDQIPPVRAFWSLTMYDQRQLFAANPISRYAIGDRDKLAFNPDGSLDLYIQRDSPGAEREANWLPAPASGTFTMNLRLYWPKPQALDGAWAPPPVRPVG